MMEGFLDATSGSILIEGHSVHSGMQGTAGLVGICPQHDLLWESLTGREHLLFYARLHAFKVGKNAHKQTDINRKDTERNKKTRKENKRACLLACINREPSRFPTTCPCLPDGEIHTC